MNGRYRFTWAFYDYGLNMVALAGLDNDKINFQEKIDELEKNDKKLDSFIKQLFELFVNDINRLHRIIKISLDEDDAKCKQLYKKIIDKVAYGIKLDLQELEIELFNHAF